jgi:hypothetical protein
MCCVGAIPRCANLAQIAYTHAYIHTYRLHPGKTLDELRPLLCGPKKQSETRKKDLSEVWDEAFSVSSAVTYSMLLHA